MMEIELERYQNMFAGEAKQKAKHEISLSQTASIIEASAGLLQEPTEAAQEIQSKKISGAFGARGAYIGSALSGVATHYFFLWAAVFTAVMVLLNKVLNAIESGQTSEAFFGKSKKGTSVNFALDAAKAHAKEQQETDTGSQYLEMAAPKSNSDI